MGDRSQPLCQRVMKNNQDFSEKVFAEARNRTCRDMGWGKPYAVKTEAAAIGKLSVFQGSGSPSGSRGARKGGYKICLVRRDCRADSESLPCWSWLAAVGTGDRLVLRWGPCGWSICPGVPKGGECRVQTLVGARLGTCVEMASRLGHSNLIQINFNLVKSMNTMFISNW